MAELPKVKIGDLVQVGRGRKVWRVASFWGTSEHPMADLTPTDGYSRSSALISRLTVVERAGEDQALAVLTAARAATDNGVRHELDDVAREFEAEESPDGA